MNTQKRPCRSISSLSILSRLILLLALSLTGCAPLQKEVVKEEPMPEICAQELKQCFGENYILSEGVEKENHFFDEQEKVEYITHYTEWELTYRDADNLERTFPFNNYYYPGDARERLEKFMEAHFSDLVLACYQQHFWTETAKKIPGYRPDDSVLSFQDYPLFTYADDPETSIMFQERLAYSLTEHIYFPNLKYNTVFTEFPYRLNLYLYADYESEEEAEQALQRQTIEEILRQMTDAMISYTEESLNMKVSVSMMDKDGYADGFSFSILNGAYFEGGNNTDFEKALHENFFGPIGQAAE